MTIMQVQTTPKRRDKLLIMAEIIDHTQKGALKTQIMYKANLSFAQLSQYLQFLTRKNLIEKASIEGKEFYKATQKGIDFMEKQQQVVNMLNEESQLSDPKNPFAKPEKHSTKPQ